MRGNSVCLACIQKVDFLDLKTFSKKAYLIHFSNLWISDGGNAVLISVLV